MSVALVAVFDAFVLYQGLQFVFAGVAKWWMSEIMGETSSFGYIWIDTPEPLYLRRLFPIQLFSEPPGDLANFQGMGEAVMEDVTPVWRDDLRNFGQTRE